MPIYVYEAINPDGSGGDAFEVLQSMSEAALTVHPESGAPVRKVIGTPNAPRTWTGSQMKSNLSDKSLDRMGFTKYVKAGNGKYQKTVGSGPDMISKPPKGG